MGARRNFFQMKTNSGSYLGFSFVGKISVVGKLDDLGKPLRACKVTWLRYARVFSQPSWYFDNLTMREINAYCTHDRKMSLRQQTKKWKRNHSVMSWDAQKMWKRARANRSTRFEQSFDTLVLLQITPLSQFHYFKRYSCVYDLWNAFWILEMWIQPCEILSCCVDIASEMKLGRSLHYKEC